MERISIFFSVAFEVLCDILATFRRQALSRGYLLALAIWVIALVFAGVALHPILYSFIYPLF